MIADFPHFQNFICQKVLPIVYDESLSYLEVLEKLSNYVNDMVTSVNEVIEKHNELSKEYQNVLIQLQEIKANIEQMKKENYLIKDGSIDFDKFSTECKRELENFIIERLSEIAKFVWFGLSDDGHFIAIIPQAWTDIVFDTDIEGHLILKI